MKLTDIHNLSLTNITNMGLSGLHRRMHQMWALSGTKKYNKNYVKYAHISIASEMERRGLKHATPLKQSMIESYIMFLSMEDF